MDFELWIIGKKIALYSVLLVILRIQVLSLKIYYFSYIYIDIQLWKKICQVAFTFYQPFDSFKKTKSNSGRGWFFIDLLILKW